MGDQSHIIELVDQILEETAGNPSLQKKIFDLRDALLNAQQIAQQYAQKIGSMEEAIQKLKSPAHRIGTVIGPGMNDLYRLNVGGTEYQAAADPGHIGLEAPEQGREGVGVAASRPLGKRGIAHVGAIRRGIFSGHQAPRRPSGRLQPGGPGSGVGDLL